ncbi:MAG: VWA domain-containing protein [Flavobacteriales bacterium]|nr:VWA domain-containing protein [Flavobacteriales bacterium]
MDLTTAHSLWLAPLCLALGVALAWWLYRRAGARDGFSPGLARGLAVVRALAIALIAFFLLEPMVRTMLRDVRKPVLVIAHDGSSSLRFAGDTTRLRTTYRSALEDLAERLSDRFLVRTFTYGDHVREGLSFEQGDALTDISQLLREAYDRFSGPDLGAVVLTGDGIHNRGRDPRLEAARLGVPVFTIALGDTTVRPDLLLKDVEHNRISYLGNDFPLLARIEARRLVGASTRVTVSSSGREIASQEVRITGDPFIAELPFTIRTEKPGLQRYTVTVRPLDREDTDLNNSMDVYIDVLDDRQKILLLGDAPHPDLGALRLALGGMEGYGSELRFAADFTGSAEAFDLIVLHRLPSPKHPVEGLLARAREKGIPVLFILGPGMDLNAFNAQGAGMRVMGGRAAHSDVHALVDRGATAFALDEDQVRAFERFPPLQAPFGQYELGRSATAMMRQRIGAVRTEQPLLVVQQQGERRTAVFAGEGLWRWRSADLQQNGSHVRFDRLVHKLAQYLALKADRSRFRVDHAPVFLENERILMRAELYDATYELVNTPEAAITLTDEDGRDYPYAFLRAGNAYRLDAGRLPPGRYAWQASAPFDGQRFTAKGELLVKGLVAERLNTAADHGLLEDLAVRTGGMMFAPEAMEALEAAIRERPGLVARSYVQASFSDLIGLRWLFFVLLGLLALEWVLRRRHGAY